MRITDPLFEHATVSFIFGFTSALIPLHPNLNILILVLYIGRCSLFATQLVVIDLRGFLVLLGTAEYHRITSFATIRSHSASPSSECTEKRR